MAGTQNQVNTYARSSAGRTRPADAFVKKAGSNYKVHAPAPVNGTTGEFLFANLTREVAMVTLPEMAVLPGVGPTDVPADEIAVFPLRPGAGGAFSYSVVMKVGGDKLVTAEGHSDPEMIVDPPAS